MPLLADIFSAGDTLKRRIRDFASDPMLYAEQMGGIAQEQGKELKSLRDLAFGDPKDPLKITNRQAFDAYAERAMEGPLSFANMGITKVGGKTLREILYGDKPNLAPAEKAAITRYEKELLNPAVLRREKMRIVGGENILAPTPGTTFVPEVGIRPETLVDKRIVPVMGDLSIAGNTVSQIAGVPLSRPVVQQGGRLYSQIEPNVQQGVGWASEPAAASSKTANLNKWSDEDTLGVFLGMGPESINFSHHMAEGMIGQLAALKPSREAIRELNQTIRNASVVNQETKEVSYPFKNFVGVDSPSIYEAMANDGQLRKAIVEKMSLAKFRNMGFPRWEDTAAVMTEPGLKQGFAGQTMFRATPGGTVLEPIYKHGSYSAGIPGQYLGGLLNAQGEVVGVPARLLWPKTYEGMEAAGKKEAQIARSMQMKHHGEKFTAEALDPLMKFLGY